VSYTTFTVTVSNPGSGNKFYIDGVLQAAVPLAYGATYRFDQSDSSNAGHTLKFSTTSDGTHGGGSAYVPGITLVGTPGQAGAYTQFFVTEVGPPLTMYYYEVDDSGMGGTANLTANSWGGLYWGHTAWGDQGQVDISVSGVSSTSSIGSATTTANADVSVSGIQITSSQGTTVGGTSALVLPTTAGLLQTACGEEDIARGIQQNVTGTALSTSSGAVTIDDQYLIGAGWGRDEWGNLTWGDAYSVQVTGQSLTSSIGEESTVADANVSVTGLSTTLTFGTYSVQADADLSITVAEHTLNSSIGTQSLVQSTNESVTGQSLTGSVGSTIAGLKTPVDVTGSQGTMSIGSISLVQGTTELATGQALTSSIGTQSSIPAQIVGVSGQSLTASLGEEGTVQTSNVSPTGQSLTFSTGEVNIFAWSEIDPDVVNIWHEVDLAA